MNAFSESLRQEVTDPATSASRWSSRAPPRPSSAGHNRPEVLEGIGRMFGDIERLTAEDIASAVAYMRDQPAPTCQ